MVKRYETHMDFPSEPILDRNWHPAPSDLKLNHSYEGDWARLSVDRDDKSGPLYKRYHIVRVEKYIDEEGDIKKAVCYQRDASALFVWFKYEDMTKAFPHWVTPTPSYYFNGRRWLNDLKKDYAHLEKPLTWPVNRDNSSSNNANVRQNNSNNNNKKLNNEKQNPAR